jgi:hypothetical protein
MREEELPVYQQLMRTLAPAQYAAVKALCFLPDITIRISVTLHDA